MHDNPRFESGIRMYACVAFLAWIYEFSVGLYMHANGWIGPTMHAQILGTILPYLSRIVIVCGRIQRWSPCGRIRQVHKPLVF